MVRALNKYLRGGSCEDGVNVDPCSLLLYPSQVVGFKGHGFQ